jgi:lysophospholipase L1-like esterase
MHTVIRATLCLLLSLSAALLAALAGCGSGPAPASPPPSAVPSGSQPAPWYEAEIRAFEAADHTAMPAPGSVLFIGSSSIRLWSTLERDMAPARVLNRGFGGSKTADVLAVFDRIAAPYNPAIIVYYCGDNDLGTDNTNARAAADGFIAFDRRARALWPAVRTFYLPIKPSLARWNNWPAMREANRLVREYCERTPGAAYLDTVSVTLGPDGKPDPTLFMPDGLHINALGYERWTTVVRPAVLEAWSQRPREASSRR